ncbi:uncharacterized protein LOC131611875 [Vicia villosa]|uniref:uncharacterized protein LOC131611875 n=1 Tax=Vicia villosa TaxID=3911 RepID=UPI00273B05F6|nr:uncharacterized protein LOC131611875 [Vicia villosa]
MGNALCGDQFHVILGNHASINMIKDDDDSDDDDSDDDDEDCECWIMRYNIFMTNCTLMLGKFMDDRDRVNVVVLGLTDHICYGQGMNLEIHRSSRRAENNSLHFIYSCDPGFKYTTSFKFNESFNRDGGVSTWVFCYGRAGRGGLVVIEGKRKSREDNKLYAITVAHYYAFNSGYILGQNSLDIGLSMIVNFHVSNACLNYTVNGPIRHPSSALFYMFEQVYKTVNWKLTLCPHCAGDALSKYNTNNNQSTNMAWLGSEISKNQSQPSASHQQIGLTSQPVLDKRYPKFLPNPPQHGPKENKRLQLIDNQDIKGNGNGNNIEGDQKFKISIPFKFVNNFLKM